MAAPVRNLTAPTGLSRMAPSLPVPAIRPTLPGRLVAQVLTPLRPPTVQRGAMGRPMAVPAVKIQPPARLVFNTFPAVYKDRANTNATPSPTTGRIHPRGTQ